MQSLMEMTYAKLKGRIVEKYGTQENFCRAIGMSKVSISKKMNGKTGFSQREIIKWCDALDIPLEEVGLFFYK